LGLRGTGTAIVSSGAGLGCLGFVLLNPFPELGNPSFGIGVGMARRSRGRRVDPLLNGSQAGFQPPEPFPGNPAGHLPAFLDGPKLGSGGFDIARSVDAFGGGDQFFPSCQITLNFGITPGEGCGAAGIEAFLGQAEALP
jgi:hypothetical protein